MSEEIKDFKLSEIMDRFQVSTEDLFAVWFSFHLLHDASKPEIIPDYPGMLKKLKTARSKKALELFALIGMYSMDDVFKGVWEGKKILEGKNEPTKI